MLTLFFSYSHRDQSLRDELEIHLAMLKREGTISTWHDGRIVAGQDFDDSIKERLESADIVLLLISPYFLNSAYCYDIELKHAMERHDTNEAHVIPVILEPCDWHHAPFGRLRATRDGNPTAALLDGRVHYLVGPDHCRVRATNPHRHQSLHLTHPTTVSVVSP
jgi:hypothetical protein